MWHTFNQPLRVMAAAGSLRSEAMPIQSDWGLVLGRADLVINNAACHSIHAAQPARASRSGWSIGGTANLTSVIST